MPLHFTRVMLCAAVMLSPSAPGSAQTKPLTAPEAFTSLIEVKTPIAGAAASRVRVQIDRYTPEQERKTMTDALTHGGYPDFLVALRKASAVGRVELGGSQFTVRWARETPRSTGRAITVVTDAPVYFVGGGQADAKPRAGFELSVIQITVDEYGSGLGTMAAAARIKPDGSGGVVLEDYAEQPIKLTMVRREVK